MNHVQWCLAKIKTMGAIGARSVLDNIEAAKYRGFPDVIISALVAKAGDCTPEQIQKADEGFKRSFFAK